jgi:dolichol-phosphate mannosyltransferase
MYYEEEVANECYSRLTKVLSELSDYTYELIFIDDGSKDKTLTILENIAKNDDKVKIISFSRNFGHQCAISAGLNYVTGDAAVIIDADLQDPPEIIPEMISLWEEGNDIVYAKRKSREKETIFKIITAKIYYIVLNFLSDINIPKDTGDYRLISKRIVDEINKMPEHNKFLRGLFSWVGFKQIALEYERKSRYAGTTKYPIKKMIRFGLDGIISFSTKPLRVVGQLGIITIIISFCLLLYALISYFINRDTVVTGWTSLIVAITFFSGVQLLSLWIISEYIASIYDESRQRPPYIISKKINI